MRYHGFDLNLLVYLNALLEEQSVSKAAQKLHITQPAVSEALNRLRDHYSDEILVSVGRRMVPTELGQSLLEQVQNVLAQVLTVANSQVRFDPTSSNRRFRIIASDYVADVILDLLIAALAKEAPHIEIDLRQLTLESKEQIKRSEVDLLIAPLEIIYSELLRVPLWSDEISGLAWSGNENIHEVITPEQYATLGHVRANINIVPASFKNASSVARDEIVVPQLGMIPRALIGTNRIAILPRRQALIYLRHYPLKIVSLPLQLPGFTEYMQWNAFQENDHGHVWFRERIKSLAGQVTQN